MYDIEKEKNRLLMNDIKYKIQNNFIDNKVCIEAYNYIHDIDIETSIVKIELTKAKDIESMKKEEKYNIIYTLEYPNIDDNIFLLNSDFILHFNLREFFKDEFNKEYKYYNDDTGEYETVVIITKNKVLIKVKFLFKYMYENKMNLSIEFDYMRYSKYKLEDLDITEKQSIEKPSSNITYNQTINYCHRTMSSLWGVSFINYPDLSDYKKYKKYEEFIIDVDDYGTETLFSCNIDEISKHDREYPQDNYYTKPIYFRKEVLKKYIDDDKYFVGDGICKRKDNFWIIEIDNSGDEYVAVPFSRLHYLPHEEQLYWKSYNVYNDKCNITITAFIRWYVGVGAEPIGSDLKFKKLFPIFNKNWNYKFHWHLFKPLNEDDKHNFESLFLVENTIKKFDEIILSLSKILIDSLNENELENEIKKHNYTLEKDSKGIKKLEIFLKINNVENTDDIIASFRNLQNIRSSSVAHRKSNSKKFTESIKFFYEDENNFNEVLKNIFNNFINILVTLDKIFLN